MWRIWLLLVGCLLTAALACNFPVDTAATATPSPIPQAAPKSTATPIPTPRTPQGMICVLAYEDANGNARRDDGEDPLPGVLFALRHGPSTAQTEVTSGADPYCFRDLPAGIYHLLASTPEGFSATNPVELQISLAGDSRVPAELGYQLVSIQSGLPVRIGHQESAAAVSSAGPGSLVLYMTTDSALHRSEDGGLTWQVMGEAPPSRNLVVSPADTSLLYTGDGPACFRDGPESPLLVSYDAGASWMESAEGVNLRPAAAHPTDSSVAWSIGCDGAYRTDDGGSTWSRTAADAWGLYTLVSITPIHGHPDVLYAAGNSEGGSGAVLRSADGGATWDIVSEQLPLWVASLVTNPSNPDEVWFASPDGVRHTQDAGESWSLLTDGLEAVVVGVDLQFEGKGLFALARSDSGSLFVATAAGLMSSQDDGQSWQSLMEGSFATERIEVLTTTSTVDGPILWLATEGGVVTITSPG